MGRSREGAWIEIEWLKLSVIAWTVAPARERGLKYLLNNLLPKKIRRSREGAWIEIFLCFELVRMTNVAPARERGLKYGRNG